jgi:two-component system, cell cycle sensor histidine kinase and response regulator CckA
MQGHSASFDTEVNGRVLQAHVKPVRNSDGDVVGVAGIAIDTTEHTVAERALRLSEQSYRSLIEDAPYAICRSTMGGELLQVNRAMTEMLGYDAASSPELLLRDLQLIFVPPGSFEEFRKTLFSGEPRGGSEGVWVRRDGRQIQVRLSGRILRGVSVNVSHLDIFAENVTEKKQLEAELGQAQKMHAIGQLAGGVAHDFNNLLTVILGHTGMLLSDAGDSASRDSLEAVQEAATKAAALTKQLLAFSRRQMLRSQTLNLNEVIGNLTGMLSRLIKEDIELVFRPGDNLGSVIADAGEIERVLLNLTVNAQDAMPDGGRLTIETANVNSDHVEIAVRDTGIGMTRETQARVFEPFFTTKQPNEGTGLGLSVVYGVVRQSGGSIRMESAPGAGTTFRIYLPRVDAVAAPTRIVPPLVSPPHGSETILFAEDDASIRRLVSGFLEGLGYRVLTVADGVAAANLAQSWQGEIHLLLTDFIMPLLGGRELAEKLKAGDPRLKVIFISGYAGHAVDQKDLHLGDVYFLHKPFSMELLATSVRNVLDGTP